MEGWPRSVRWLVWLFLGVTAAMTLWILLAPELYSDEHVLEHLRRNRDAWLSGLIPLIVLPMPVSMVIGLIAGTVTYLLARRWASWSDHFLTASVVVAVGLWPLAAFLWAASNFESDVSLFETKAGATPEVRIAHVAGIALDEGYAGRLGRAVPLQSNANLSGSFLLNGSSIWELAQPQAGAFSVRQPPPTEYFSSGEQSISDLFVRRTKLFVVVDADLIAIDFDTQKPSKLAKLPFPGMRFGQIKHSFGAASALLLFGNDQEQSFVYELRPSGKYAKLMQGDERVVGAGGCFEETFVAFEKRILGLRPGHKPSLVFRVPGNEKITSVLVRQHALSERTQCSLLIATANAVFALQDGATTMLIMGIGGRLTAEEESNAAFQVVDAARNIVVGVTFVGLTPNQEVP